MASLQDQLLKAGLIDTSSAKRANKDKHKEQKQARKTAGKNHRPKLSEQSTIAEQNRERDRALNQQRQEEANRKAVAAQIRQLIETHKISTDEGDIPYHFVHQNKVKTLYLTPLQKEQIGKGYLAIVIAASGNTLKFELAPSAIAAKITERDRNHVVETASDNERTTDEDDPYRDYQIPDDLIW